MVGGKDLTEHCMSQSDTQMAPPKQQQLQQKRHSTLIIATIVGTTTTTLRNISSWLNVTDRTE